MPDQDPLSNFLDNLAKKIQVTKEHKDIMEAVYSSASATEVVKEQEDPFAKFLKKIGNAVSEKLPTTIQPDSDVVVEEVKEDATVVLGKKIKEAIENAKTKQPEEKEDGNPSEVIQAKEEIPQQVDENKPVKELAQKIKDAIENAKTEALAPQPPSSVVEDEQISSYIDELEKIKDTGTAQQKEEATTSLKELKKYIDKTVQDYARRILDLGSGGGSVAVQYARGGTMDGTLNVNGQILSGGRDISNYFGSGGGGGGGDPAVNTVVYTSSGNWNSTYTNTNYFSAFWNAAVDELFTFYITQTDPGSAFISEDGNYYIIANSKLDNVSLWNNVFTQVYLLSSQWSSVYVTVLGTSARWDSVYTSFNENSGRYESVYNTTQTSSGSWSSVYNTYQSLSASYAAETLAIAYAVAL